MLVYKALFPSGHPWALGVLIYSLQGGEGLLPEASGNAHSKSDSTGLSQAFSNCSLLTCSMGISPPSSVRGMAEAWGS